ncbi:hypothetical protein CEXT_410021 [Caerostris extrusa]|uniref:Secreted protein n=1 Tax=Caerostris extrusa TaxID=172846 RepID=A0AAV4XIZ2_CAEEX|nr:hypothetical protein CEXT_410021 [Caerostris extrusa]
MGSAVVLLWPRFVLLPVRSVRGGCSKGDGGWFRRWIFQIPWQFDPGSAFGNDVHCGRARLLAVRGPVWSVPVTVK